jgi:hypothetical protein
VPSKLVQGHRIPTSMHLVPGFLVKSSGRSRSLLLPLCKSSLLQSSFHRLCLQNAGFSGPPGGPCVVCPSGRWNGAVNGVCQPCPSGTFVSCCVSNCFHAQGAHHLLALPSSKPAFVYDCHCWCQCSVFFDLLHLCMPGSVVHRPKRRPVLAVSTSNLQAPTWKPGVHTLPEWRNSALGSFGHTEIRLCEWHWKQDAADAQLAQRSPGVQRRALCKSLSVHDNLHRPTQ